MNIKRYNAYLYRQIPVDPVEWGMEDDEEGLYVRYEDHIRIVKQLEDEKQSYLYLGNQQSM